MDSTRVQETKRRSRERQWAAFMRGAEEGMIELRGAPLTDAERAEAEALADGLYGDPAKLETVGAAS